MTKTTTPMTIPAKSDKYNFLKKIGWLGSYIKNLPAREYKKWEDKDKKIQGLKKEKMTKFREKAESMDNFRKVR